MCFKLHADEIRYFSISVLHTFENAYSIDISCQKIHGRQSFIYWLKTKEVLLTYFHWGKSMKKTMYWIYFFALCNGHSYTTKWQIMKGYQEKRAYFRIIKNESLIGNFINNLVSISSQNFDNGITTSNGGHYNHFLSFIVHSQQFLINFCHSYSIKINSLVQSIWPLLDSLFHPWPY